MTTTIPNLWPEQFNVDVQTPLTILRVQAGLLGKVTRGILQGTVETEAGKEKVQHRLVVIAPAYNSYRHTLIVASHDVDLPYPAEVRAQALAEKVKREPNTMYSSIPFPSQYETVYPSANNDEQMVRLVERALRSESTMAVILSLIAKSNEASMVSTESSQGSDLGEITANSPPS